MPAEALKLPQTNTADEIYKVNRTDTERPLIIPFGLKNDLLTIIPDTEAMAGSIYPTATDRNDRQGDRD